jgi:hypothetical protein
VFLALDNLQARESQQGCLSLAASFMSVPASGHLAGRPSMTCRTPLPRVAASLNPIIDFFNAGCHGGLSRPELRVTDHIRTGSRVDGPVPPRRRAFINVKFCAAMSQRVLLLVQVKSTKTARGCVFTKTTIPPFGFDRTHESPRRSGKLKA